jgi:hypothetical protein
MDNELLTQLKNIFILVDTLEKNVMNNTDTKNIVEQIDANKVEITNILNLENF